MAKRKLAKEEKKLVTEEPVPRNVIAIVAHLATGEVTAWPTNAKVQVKDEVEWQIYQDASKGGIFPPHRAEVTKLDVPFALRFYPADGFNKVEVEGAGSGRATAKKQGVYHYEVAFTIDDRVFALFGCPSAEVRR